MTRVLLLEPDSWRYRGLAAVLADSGTCEVVGEPDYTHVLSLAAQPEDLHADVVMIAHRLVLEYGVAIIALMRDVFAPATVLVHGEVESLEVAAQVYAAGAHGYFVLGHPPGLLPKAVAVVAGGKYWGPREAVALMAQRMIGGESPPSSTDTQDRELLDLLQEGLSNKEIAQRLGLAEPTIKARFNKLYRKYGVATRLQLLTTAIKRGALRRDHD